MEMRGLSKGRIKQIRRQSGGDEAVFLGERDDIPGLCKWLTGVFALNPAHPVTGW